MRLVQRCTAMSFEYIEVLYNRKREHSSLDYKSPIRFLDDWLIALQKEKLVASPPIGRQKTGGISTRVCPVTTQTRSG